MRWLLRLRRLRKLGVGVGCPLTWRYKQVEVWALKESEKWKLNIL